jgi:hypothetical protein
MSSAIPSRSPTSIPGCRRLKRASRPGTSRSPARSSAPIQIRLRTTPTSSSTLPRTWRHPTKVFLGEWYRRIGYRPILATSPDEAHPDLAPLLATTSDFVVYEKPLDVVAGAGQRRLAG